VEAGYLGVGNMGQPMAHKLLDAGHGLTIYDINEAAMQPLLARQARRARSPKDLADCCKIVFVSLPTLAAFREVAFGSPVRGTTPAGLDSERLELDRLGPVPKGQPAELGQVLGSRDDRQEVVADELPDLAGETDAAIGEQDLGALSSRGGSSDIRGASGR
jgi:hypothetical protein